MLETSARLLRLLALLQARRYWTGPELAARLEVTERTLRRDVARLRDLGYPVESSAGVAGGYQLGSGGELPPLLLDDEEAVAVALSLRTAAAGTVSGMEEVAIRALTKLEQMLPKRVKARVAALHAAIVPLYWSRPQISPERLTALASGCRDETQVSFRYGDLRGRASERTVEPHGLVHSGARWYLLAWDPSRDDWRTFRVDRIAGIPTAGPRFVRRPIPGGDAGAYVSRSVGSQPYAYRARVVLDAPYAELRDRISPLSGHLEALEGGRCRLETGGPSPASLVLYIANLGAPFVIEDPPELREAAAAMAARLAAAAKG